MTYSPKVFIPLTMLCRDRCGYCTFAKAPARIAEPYLIPDEVLAIARAGAAAGCHEALFTLGERPEERYPVAARGWPSTATPRRSTTSSPCAPGAGRDRPAPPRQRRGAVRTSWPRLRPVSASQGMMLETPRADLDCHRGSPDKTPERRLATLEAAGELAIPFTTGILVGIGESRAGPARRPGGHRRRPRRHGHVQEVIVQNFLPKPGTAMHGAPPCPADEYLWTIAAARLVLPADVHVQAPPNLSDDFGALLDAGIDDWGGVSPVTVDHVNPERPWPALERPPERDRGAPGSPWRPGSRSTRRSRSNPAGGWTRPCASPCWTAATPRGSGATSTGGRRAGR